MSGNSSDHARSTAVNQLKNLGLSTYAARTFVGLVSLGEGTAQDVSDVVDVPRTRVYDAAEELHERGLVDVKQSNPRRYWAISTETTARHFEQEYIQRVTALTEALDQLASGNHSTEQQGVWTVTGRDSITDRVVEFISSADDEVVYMTIEELLTDEITETLSTVSDSGASIRLPKMSDCVMAKFKQEVPTAQLFESLWNWSDSPAGRVLMVDKHKTLVSVLVDSHGKYPPEPREETAIWGTGQTNSLVIVLKALFTWQLDNNRDSQDG